METIVSHACLIINLIMSMDTPIILFDGTCNLCNGSVSFVIKHGGKDKFLFLALQSEQAKGLLPENYIIEQSPDSIVYLENKKVCLRSTAILKILKRMGGGWKILYVFILIPRILRDSLYDLVARHRHRWFGKNDDCELPSGGANKSQ